MPPIERPRAPHELPTGPVGTNDRTAAPAVEPPASLRILLIDDDPFLREEIGLHLLSDGHVVEQAASAEEALQALHGFHPQMVITDWMHEGMDGLELCRHLRRSADGRLLYVMMLTRFDDEDSLVRSFEAGADDFVRKPLTPRILLARVRAASRLIYLQREVDQTRREQLEAERTRRQLQQAQKIQSLGRLTGGIAHNFNNSLASILGYAELAMEMFADVGDGTLQEFLGNIHRAGSQAGELVSALRAFSAGGDGECQTPLRRPLLEDVVQMLRPVLPASIELKTDFAEVTDEVLVNQEQIFQLVTNLSLNARDAMPGGGEIRLGLREVHEQQVLCSSCGERFSGEFLALTLADSGHGMDEQTLAAIFDPFFSTHEVGRGTGLGLSMVHGIMHGNGGHVVVESALGEGCRVQLLFPRRPVERGSR